MRTFALLVAFAACSEPTAVDPIDAASAALPRGSWRTGAWTCIEDCAATSPSAATPPVTVTTWVDIGESTIRWFNSGGALILENPGEIDGICWRTTLDGVPGNVCGSLCDGQACVTVDRLVLDGRTWRFMATR